MSQPQVSVLMSVFNGRRYLAGAIESVLDQTLGDLELILVDDGSTDDSWSIISEFAQRDSRVVPIRQTENLGTSVALNKGLALARGKYIARQDSDDLSLPKRLAEQVSFLEDDPDIGAVGTAVLLIDNASQLIEQQNFPADNDEIQELLLDQMCFCGPSVMIRRESLLDAGFYFDEALSYSEDYDQCLRLAEVTKLANLQTPLYKYRQHEGSVSHSKRFKQMSRKAEALERAVYRRAGSNPDPDYVTKVARDYLRASAIGYLGGDLAGARHALARSLALEQTILHNGELVEEVVGQYARAQSVEPALKFVDTIFRELFPSSRNLRRVRGRLLGRLHMQEVFDGVEKNDWQRVDNHLWDGIYSDPSWLMNRGIVSLMLRRIFRS